MSSAVSCELETVLEPYESVRLFGVSAHRATSGRTAETNGRTADLDRRVEEDDVGRLGPRVGVVSRVEPAVRDGARAELKEETSGRRALRRDGGRSACCGTEMAEGPVVPFSRPRTSGRRTHSRTAVDPEDERVLLRVL